MRDFDERLGDIVAAWITLVVRVPWLVVALASLAVGAALVYAAPRLGLNSDEDALFSPDVKYAELRREFREAFPALLDPVIVIIDARSADTAREASLALRRKLEARPELFPAVFDPSASAFFKDHGMLYLERDALYDVADRIAAAQPFLAEWSADPTVRGSAKLATRALEAAEAGESGPGLDAFIEALADSAATLGSATPTPTTGKGR